jgi:hydroxypyruvate reductase
VAVAQWLTDPRSETPKANHAAFAQVRNLLITTPGAALQAASAHASAAGATVRLLGAELEGEARVLAASQARQALALRAQQPESGVRRAQLLLSGGETTVVVRGTGRGGRNAEYLLALALALDGAPGIWALAADTDGIDGTEDNAGALIGPDTLARGRALGLDAAVRLEANDAYGYFAALGDLLVTGPTRTNVNDFRAIYIA